MDYEKNPKREVEVVIISDVHLGTYGCHAKELVHYLKSIKPKTLILNGDIIDIWQFRKRYFPKSHFRVIKQITSMMSKGTKVFYVTGNHDDMLRRFAGFSMPSLKIVNKVVMELDGKKTWVFHGDVFDVTMQYSRWLTHLGATGYDLLILLNRAVNFMLVKFGKEKISFSKKIKNGVKSAVKYINDFEKICAEIAVRERYDYVACGHIHHPEIKTIASDSGEVVYLNSGDWVENLTSLEYHEGQWRIYHHHLDDSLLGEENQEDLDTKQLFENLLEEFTLKKVS